MSDTYRVQATLRDATIDEVKELVNILTDVTIVDLEVTAFEVSAFKQNEDQGWTAIDLEGNES
jgi:hypothetical protein